jgi:hypothetical protein
MTDSLETFTAGFAREAASPPLTFFLKSYCVIREWSAKTLKQPIAYLLLGRLPFLWHLLTFATNSASDKREYINHLSLSSNTALHARR